MISFVLTMGTDKTYLILWRLSYIAAIYKRKAGKENV